ncbi:unnamed protein product, partial [Hapterophycus canaliculatus]
QQVAQQKVVEQTSQSNNNSFAGLDGFKAPQPQGMGMNRPLSGMTGLSGGSGGGMMMGGGGGGFQQQMQQQQHQVPVQGGWMGATQHGMGAGAAGGM